ncbi:MAG: hypothetical protein ACFFDH_23910 [Promethearchaeota archaeon]
MSEEDIKRIEKKVDLLYKILLKSDNVYAVYQYLEEFIPLFNLSIEIKERPEGIISNEEFLTMAKKEHEELNKLSSKFKDENLSVKEHKELPPQIKFQEDKLKDLEHISKLYVGIINLEKLLREELLKLNLQEKIGLELIKDEWNNDFYQKERYEQDIKEQYDLIKEFWEEYNKKYGNNQC